MKRFLFLFTAAVILSGCGKTFLKRTSVMIVSDDAVVNVDFTNDGEKHLENLTDDEIKAIYLQEFKDELGRGKIDVVTSNPDYIIEIKQINIQEWVEAVYEEDRWIDLSKIDIETKLVMTKSLEDIPNTFFVEDSVQEEIEEDKKGKGSKGNKGGKQTSGTVEIDGFGGINGAFESHGKEARSEIKKRIKQNQ